MRSVLHTFHVIVSVLAGANSLLLGVLFWSSSVTNQSAFTKQFLKFLTLCATLKTIEIAFAAYGRARIAPECIPWDSAIFGIAGRGIELAGYIVMTWFLLKPETKRALNGASKGELKS